jgi:hypothetical protein
MAAKWQQKLGGGDVQGCQSFLGATYQNGKKCQMTINIPNDHKIYQTTIK